MKTEAQGEPLGSGLHLGCSENSSEAPRFARRASQPAWRDDAARTLRVPPFKPTQRLRLLGPYTPGPVGVGFLARGISLFFGCESAPRCWCCGRCSTDARSCTHGGAWGRGLRLETSPAPAPPSPRWASVLSPVPSAHHAGPRSCAQNEFRAGFGHQLCPVLGSPWEPVVAPQGGPCPRSSHAPSKSQWCR